MTDPVEDPAALALRVAAVVTATPGIAGLHGGTFGAITTYLPGRRLTGVYVGGPGEPVEVGVVAVFGCPIPDTVRAVRRAVAGIAAAGTRVDITVADIATAPLATAPVHGVAADGAAAAPEVPVLIGADGPVAGETPRRRVL